jgi:hypothetical protein
MKSTNGEAGQGRKRVDAWGPCSQERAQGEDTGASKGLTISQQVITVSVFILTNQIIKIKGIKK